MAKTPTPSPVPTLDKHSYQIKALAFKYWKHVPIQERNSCDVDDLVAIGYLVYHKCAQKWNPDGKAKFNTYLHSALNNRFKDFVAHAYRRHKIEMCSLTIQALDQGAREGEPHQTRKQGRALVAACETDINISYHLIRTFESERSMQRLLTVASFEDVCLIEAIMFRPDTLPADPERTLAPFFPRLRELFRSAGITYEDLRYLRHATV
jgi:DNA-directed RNA polymerase specialized sigma24 family protein